MRICDLIAQKTPFVSLEFYPPKEREQWGAFFEEAEKLKAVDPLFVSVTYGAGGGTQDNTLEIAARLKNETGFEPLVHLTTVGATEERIAAYLRDLKTSGIENILALRGDPPRGMCDFKPDNERFQHASDLVSFMRAGFPEFCVGVAGYPQPHPQSPTVAEDLAWTKFKIEQGAQFIVTQLFFDVRQYVDFVGRLKAMNVDVPVIPGILPIMSLGSIRFILSLCGASIPGKFYLELEEADKKGGAAAVSEIGLRFAIDQCRQLLDAGAPGVHLYTLNKADACLHIAGELNI
ncbi:5,10-methylenetetrahydrofolate reductase [Alkalidesulfovibrio alkalitolerans DSM 16529]|uniref:Methylenetetrahydrofolate reductase n=1 Tax=Alkalidesulfovibrio alkalitolerans DSM 16529 TaxID=1121439 RepID=S7TD98_9BACT|nr:methylenetetrahydrofolate reductase [NAD(P)H] [Alkalidesulfovibrio alkalitolerans]EPR34545.1 5,10-methylenetetrahydrofolate reductase [Alkalidesulfovibrio alkalitolerans DSM 16529]